MGRELVKMVGISKSFGALKANEEVNLAVEAGQVHALLGENGAGKSTLMNMLSGIYKPDSGSIFIDGRKTEIVSPKDAIEKGIGMIYQHFKLVDVLTARENILLGQKNKSGSKDSEIRKEIQELSNTYGLDINLDKKVYEMSVGEKQKLEIIKVLYRGAKILILDEPTAVLTPQEIIKLFTIIQNMKEQECAVIIITHKLNEVTQISDQVTVLRKGTSIGSAVTKDVPVSDLIEMMVGKKVDLDIKRDETKEKKEILVVDQVTVLDGEGKKAIDDMSFTLRSGEILGVAGVAKSGQKELCESIAGLAKAEGGRIYFNNENIMGMSPASIIRLGIRMGFIPEDRLGMGLVGAMDIVHNIVLKDYQNQPGIFLKREACRAKAKEIVERLDVKTPNVETPIKNLSGGNIQKILLGREMDSNPKVLITAYPVRGLDIGASYRIYDLLNEQKKNGVGILFVGEDLDVMMALCDRIMVLSEGKIMDIVDPKVVTKDSIGLLMAGSRMEGDN